MATETRSHSGCWSCRLRKKKCDERRPICTECMCVGLECHGFGEKPAWMDRGVRQKAQAAKMKQKVAQATKSRRMTQIRDQHETLIKRLQTPPATSTQPTASTTPSGPTPDTTTANAPAGATIINASGISPRSQETLPLEQAFDDTFQPQPTKNHFSPYQLDEGLEIHIDALPIIDPILTEFPTTFDEMDFLSDHTFDFTGLNSPPTEEARVVANAANLPTPDSLRAGLSICNAQLEIECPSDQTLSALQIKSVEDAILLAHYMEKVFHWQFRFCATPASSFNQGYLIWLMSKSRALYLASLALSSSYRSLHIGVDGLPPTMLYEDHMEKYDAAAEELQRNLRALKPMDEVSTLACIVAFIYSSFLHAGKVNWDSHLRAGTSLLAPWIAQESTEVIQELQKTPENSSREFFAASILRFDILSAITKGSTPVLSQSYQTILKSTNSPILLETVCGCQNWVFDILIDVYGLRDWKKGNRSAGLLSLWELTSKANTIKTELERRTTCNLMLMNKIKQEMELRKDDNTSSKHQQYDICVVTHNFASAVSVLLEVIVSGAHPQLPEIKYKVARALESFAYIDHPELFEVLGWPLFVVGCVVDQDQHEFFRRLLSSSNAFRSVKLDLPPGTQLVFHDESKTIASGYTVRSEKPNSNTSQDEESEKTKQPDRKGEKLPESSKEPGKQVHALTKNPTHSSRLINDLDESLLMEVYIEKIAPWMDCLDANRPFTNIVPFYALSEPLLYDTILACGAKYLMPTDTALHLGSTSQHVQLQLEDTNNEPLLCMTVEVLLKACEAMGNGLNYQHTGQASALPKRIDSDSSDSGLAGTCFWAEALMSLIQSLYHEDVPKGDPERLAHAMDTKLASGGELISGNEEQWAQRMIYICTKVAALRSDLSHDKYDNATEKLQEECEQYKDWCEEWAHNVPRTMMPLCYIPPSDKGPTTVFPQVLLVKSSAAIARLLYHTSCLLLADIQPTEDSDTEYTQRLQARHARDICGIASQAEDKCVIPTKISLDFINTNYYRH
ncbi:ustiloxin B cluster transcription factor ustR [Paramyrothecium foliicola]|nr:ustiloxin B cluster transcription factor ustR [Paramyrothecium foliicola]